MESSFHSKMAAMACFGAITASNTFTIIKIPFTQEQGDKIWEKFLITFQKKYSIEDV